MTEFTTNKKKKKKEKKINLTFVDYITYCPSSVVPVYQFSYSVMSDSLRPHGLQHARLPCPSPTPGACSDSRLSSQ